MKVLFSSVGKTDPMSGFNDNKVFDGSYLHILRNYDIDVIYLYLSKEINDFDKLDNRYERVIELYNTDYNKNVVVKKIRRRNLVDVQKFDIYYEDFETIIRKIIDEYGEDTEVLVNVSSGTPAMKSTLQIIAALSPYKVIPIQVTDPSKGKTKRTTELNTYDVCQYWNNNIDNQEKQNRTYLSQNDSFNFKIQKEMIMSLITSYDYDAANKLIHQYKYRVDQSILDLLEFAVNRYNLDFDSIIAMNKKYNWNLLPYTDNTIKLFEYVLWLKMKIEKEEILDFVRGLNPFLYESTQMIVKKMGIDIDKYCKKDNNTRKLKKNLLIRDKTGEDILKILDEKYRRAGGYNDNHFLSEEQLIIIINGKLNNNKVCDSLKELNFLRTSKRNIASHEIVSIKSTTISRDLAKGINHYLNKMKNILDYLGYDTNTYWDSYEKMNDFICEKIEKIV